MIKQKIKVFEATCKEGLEKYVNDWLNNKNNKDLKILNISASNRNQYGGYIAVVHYECEESFFSEFSPLKNLKKITITDFKNNSYSKKMCIHCDTEEKARILCENIKRSLCFDTIHWNDYKETTCYGDYGYGPIEYFKDNGYKIYEFEDIIFE